MIGNTAELSREEKLKFCSSNCTAPTLYKPREALLQVTQKIKDFSPNFHKYGYLSDAQVYRQNTSSIVSTAHSQKDLCALLTGVCGLYLVQRAPSGGPSSDKNWRELVNKMGRFALTPTQILDPKRAQEFQDYAAKKAQKAILLPQDYIDSIRSIAALAREIEIHTGQGVMVCFTDQEYLPTLAYNTATILLPDHINSYSKFNMISAVFDRATAHLKRYLEIQENIGYTPLSRSEQQKVNEQLLTPQEASKKILQMIRDALPCNSGHAYLASPETYTTFQIHTRLQNQQPWVTLMAQVAALHSIQNNISPPADFTLPNHYKEPIIAFALLINLLEKTTSMQAKVFFCHGGHLIFKEYLYTLANGSVLIILPSNPNSYKASKIVFDILKNAHLNLARCIIAEPIGQACCPNIGCAVATATNQLLTWAMGDTDNQKLATPELPRASIAPLKLLLSFHNAVIKPFFANIPTENPRFLKIVQMLTESSQPHDLIGSMLPTLPKTHNVSLEEQTAHAVKDWWSASERLTICSADQFTRIIDKMASFTSKAFQQEFPSQYKFLIVPIVKQLPNNLQVSCLPSHQLIFSMHMINPQHALAILPNQRTILSEKNFDQGCVFLRCLMDIPYLIAREFEGQPTQYGANFVQSVHRCLS